jgi:hypothetical protein
MQLRDSLGELLAMDDVVLRNAADAIGEFAQNPGEQAEAQVHVNGLAHVLGPGPLKRERKPGRIEMGLEPR